MAYTNPLPDAFTSSFFVDAPGGVLENAIAKDPKAKLYPELGDLRASIGGELRLNFKIANNPLNTVPLATIAKSAVPALNNFNDSAGVFRLGIGQPIVPVPNGAGTNIWLGPMVFTEFGTFF